MLFHVTMSVRVPFGTDPDLVRRLSAQEHERAADLQRAAKWKHLWRVAGQWSNVSIFDVESPAELHDILESLPLRPFMEVSVTALCHHPGAVAVSD